MRTIFFDSDKFKGKLSVDKFLLAVSWILVTSRSNWTDIISTIYRNAWRENVAHEFARRRVSFPDTSTLISIIVLVRPRYILQSSVIFNTHAAVKFY